MIEGIWMRADAHKPTDGGAVIAIVSGKPKKNVTLVNALEVATYDPDEGWIVEAWPEWTEARVSWWMVPRMPEE